MRFGHYKLIASRTVTRHWYAVLLVWLVVAVGVKVTAPRWEDIAADGDLAFLPEDVPSMVGRRALEEAFPGEHARSQLVLVFANPQSSLADGDRLVAMDVARRLHWIAALSGWQHLQTLDDGAVSDEEPRGAGRPRAVLQEMVLENLTEVIELEDSMARLLAELEEDQPLGRLVEAYELRGQFYARTGQAESAAVDQATAALVRQQGKMLRFDVPAWGRLVHDVWSWRSTIVGHKLGSQDPHARLVVVQLDSDFAAVTNIRIIEQIEDWMGASRQQYAHWCSADFRAEISGAAAVGADMLRAAASGVRVTEMVTVVLVLVILTAVYRAPFLVAIPLCSIALSLIVATGLIAHLARDPSDPTSGGLGVFTTTRIFIVVLLFGAGTDFCLFLLARNRELLDRRPIRSRAQMYRVISSGWRSVHDAIVASALTTIIGLALMWFARFEKFHFSGPIIAISLAVTLVVCLSFTPALLSGLGMIAFWPRVRRGMVGRRPQGGGPAGDATGGAPGEERSPAQVADRGERPPTSRRGSRVWAGIARAVALRPATALAGAGFAILVPAVFGAWCMHRVTYDFTEELSPDSPSRRGARLIEHFFPTRDSSPVTLLVTRSEPFPEDAALQEACQQMTATLYVDGVDSVRSLVDPLGDFPPGKPMSLFAQDAWRRRALRASRIAREQFLSSVDALQRRVARFDVILVDNPFSIEAAQTIQRLRDVLRQECRRPDSPWYGAEFSLTGTAVGIADLRQVTQSDQRRIQVLVTLGVWAVLLIMLRRAAISTYLIATVLLSYFATLGITYGVFSLWYGAAYSGLDWKVPLFLFVILVAVGQDYNVYLISRVIEEMRTRSFRDAIIESLHRTGGIITSCGVVMAGTFAAMTSPAALAALAEVLPVGGWESGTPVLRGITELGFALSFGVLLDTFLVRTILVPAFLLLLNRYTSYRMAGRAAP